MELDHIGIAVEDMAQSVALYSGLLGARPAGEFELPGEGIRIVWLVSGGVGIELMAPFGDGAIARFIRKRGPGLHHLGFRVDKIEKAIEALRTAGHQMIDERARPGLGGRRIAFAHPKTAGGALIELCEGPLDLPTTAPPKAGKADTPPRPKR